MNIRVLGLSYGVSLLGIAMAQPMGLIGRPVYIEEVFVWQGMFCSTGLSGLWIFIRGAPRNTAGKNVLSIGLAILILTGLVFIAVGFGIMLI